MSRSAALLPHAVRQREEMHETGKATPAADHTIGEPVEEELERIEDDDGDKPDAPGPTPTMR